MGIPGVHSNKARLARIPGGENRLICKLQYSTPLLPQPSTSFWAQSHSFGLWSREGGQGFAGSKPSQTEQAVSGSSHASHSPARVGRSHLFSPVRDQRRGLLPGIDRQALAPFAPLAVDDSRKDFQGHSISPPCFSLQYPSRELCWYLDREHLIRLCNSSP